MSSLETDLTAHQRTVFLTHYDKNIRRSSRIVGVTLGIALAAFAGAKLYPVLHGPSIDLKTIENGATLTDPLVAIKGTIRHAQTVVVNGTALPTGPDGSFDDQVLLQPGYNVISMTASDRFGTTAARDYVVMVQEDDAEAFTMADTGPVAN